MDLRGTALRKRSDNFLLAALVAVVSLIVSVFLREVPLTKESQTPVEGIELEIEAIA